MIGELLIIIIRALTDDKTVAYADGYGLADLGGAAQRRIGIAKPIECMALI